MGNPTSKLNLFSVFGSQQPVLEPKRSRDVFEGSKLNSSSSESELESLRKMQKLTGFSHPLQAGDAFDTSVLALKFVNRESEARSMVETWQTF